MIEYSQLYLLSPPQKVDHGSRIEKNKRIDVAILVESMSIEVITYE